MLVCVSFLCVCVCVCVFFFKQKTAYEIGTGDWSSDVCSSDLGDQLWWSLAQTFGDMPCSQHLGHISPCFSEWWNTSMFGNIALSGVVSGKREDGVIAKVIQ